MIRLKYLFYFLILTLPIALVAQSTTVSGPIVDPASNIWSSAKVTAQFVEAPGVPGPYTWSGGAFNRQPTPVVTNSSGVFSLSLPSNNAIVPSGSTWQIIVSPNETLPAAIVNIALTGGTVNITTAITNAGAWPNPSIAPLVVPKTYDPAYMAVIPSNVGGFMIRTNPTIGPYWYDGTTWQPFSTTGSTCNTNCVITNPSTTQTITQASTTSFIVVTSGGGSLRSVGRTWLDCPVNIGTSSFATNVTDPVSGSVSTCFITKGTTSDSSAYVAALLDSNNRPIASFDNAGRLNLDGYNNGGSLIDLRNQQTGLSSGSLLGHYAYGMLTTTGQAITSGGMFHIMNTATQTNVNTQVLVEWDNALNASTCSGFCQPNGQFAFGPNTLTNYGGLPFVCVNQGTLAAIQCNFNQTFQIRPLGVGDTFTFPNNSDDWMHVNTAKNIRFIDDGTQASIQSINDAGNTFQALSLVASAIHLQAPSDFNNTVSLLTLTNSTAPICQLAGALTNVGCSGGGGSGTVTHTVGALTALSVIVGNGGADIKIDTGCSTDGAGTMTCVQFNTTGAVPGQGGGGDWTEGTAFTPTSGHDQIQANAAAHRMQISNNGGSFSNVFLFSDIIGPNTVTVGSGVSFAANTCSSITGVANTVSTLSITNLKTTNGLTFTATTDVKGITGWGPGAGGTLYWQPWPSAAGTSSFYVCNNTASPIVTGASTTWNVE